MGDYRLSVLAVDRVLLEESTSNVLHLVCSHRTVVTEGMGVGCVSCPQKGEEGTEERGERRGKGGERRGRERRGRERRDKKGEERSQGGGGQMTG